MNLRAETCSWCSAETLCEIRSNGQPQCLGCKVVLFFRWLYRPLGFDLLTWQEKVLRDLYGTVDSDGFRQYRSAYISVAKKNGKSFLVGGLPIYHLIAEHEQRPEAYGAASAKDQGAIVFRAATQLVRKNAALMSRLRIIDSTKRIVRNDGAGFYAVLSADGDVQDGIEPSLAILDELHRWKTAKAETLYDVIGKGMISRRQPLSIQITTAGEIYDAPLCHREYEVAKGIERGTIQSPRFYSAIWEANEERLKTEPEYWKSREARVAANPAHEDLGGFLRDEAITEELLKAESKPVERDKYFRYHLNVWVQSESRAIDLAKWDLGGAPLPTLAGRSCYIGMDLSASRDLTALAMVFPRGDEFDILPIFFIPREQIAWQKRVTYQPIDAWARTMFHAGGQTEVPLVEVTDGEVVDYRAVRRRIEWARKRFRVIEVDFDPRFAGETINELADSGVTCVEIRQGFPGMGHPTKRFLELIDGGKIHHGGHPVLRWNADCLAVKQNLEGEIMPVKPDRRTSTKRIDGIVATIMAVGRAITMKEKVPYSVRRPNGPLVLG